MLPTTIWNTLRFSSEPDWSRFAAFNETAHVALYAVLAPKMAIPYAHIQFLTQSAADQLAHWREHVAIALQQGSHVPSMNELTFDPRDESSFYNFLSYHTDYHEAALRYAGLQ